MNSLKHPNKKEREKLCSWGRIEKKLKTVGFLIPLKLQAVLLSEVFNFRLPDSTPPMRDLNTLPTCITHHTYSRQNPNLTSGANARLIIARDAMCLCPRWQKSEFLPNIFPASIGTQVSTNLNPSKSRIMNPEFQSARGSVRGVWCCTGDFYVIAHKRNLLSAKFVHLKTLQTFW